MWDDVEERIHTFFKTRGFEHVRTPLLVPSPGMEPNLSPLETVVNGKKAGFITSPEYSMKKLIGAGYERIYTITPVFRNDEGGLQNIPEFIMLEWYAPGSYDQLMKETEQLLNAVLEDEEAWPRIPYIDANMDTFGDPHVKEKRFFLTEFPVDQASLARISSDGRYAERFEAFADGFELCNGFAELTDQIEQEQRFQKEIQQRRADGKTIFPIDNELLQSLEKIKKPFYGNALGVDRLVMLKYGVSDIRDIQLFNTHL